MRSVTRLAMLMFMVLATKLAGAAEPSLTLDLGGVQHRFTASELLTRPDAADIDIPNDHDYRRATHYRAVPLLPLLADLPPDRFDTLEARALAASWRRSRCRWFARERRAVRLRGLPSSRPASPGRTCRERRRGQDRFTSSGSIPNAPA